MTSLLEKNENTLEQIIAAADAATDRDALMAARAELQTLLKEGFVETESTARPYTPALEMTEEFRGAYFPLAEGGAEAGFGRFVGGVAVDVANALSNAERRVAFRLKTLFGFDGLRLVEEGDSWTQYPLLLQDITDQLDSNDDFAIFSMGAAGDLVADMADKKEYLRALRVSKATAMLLSGGGNDLFGDLTNILVDYTAGADPASLIDDAVFGAVFEAVMSGYRTILSDVASDFPHVVIFGHGYDLPFPLENGKWIGPVLAHKRIPFDVGREVLRVIMDRFNEALADLAASQTNFEYCDLRGEVGRGTNSWFDELHPRNAGYRRAAAVIEARIRAHGQSNAETAVLDGSAGGAERATLASKTIVLDPGHGGTAAVGGSSANNAIGPRGTLEKHVTLDVAKRTRDILEGRGFNVHLTRETDVNSGLRSRAGIAKSNNAAAFVSIHFNGSTGHNAQGTETFVHSSLSSGGGKKSEALCRTVQTEMVAALGLRDRNALHPGGIKFGGFGVLNPNNHARGTAAILHEVSFLDRADEEARLATVSYRRKVATALADGIETYLQDTLNAESTILASDGVGDAFELNLMHPLSNAASASLRDTWPNFTAAHPSDISNGHMIAESGTADSFLRALAASEAHYVARNSGALGTEDEGREPSDFDPAVETVFGGMSTNAETNVGLLRGLFGGVESSGFDHGAFDTFIQSLGLRYFSVGEFLVLGGQNNSGSCAGKNTLPPQSLWSNLANTAQMIDEIRHRLDAPVFISSAYRSPAYNACIDGASQSQHKNFNALDWRCAVGSPADWFAVAAEVRSSNSNFAGFIQQYGTFVHVDTRHA